MMIVYFSYIYRLFERLVFFLIACTVVFLWACEKEAAWKLQDSLPLNTIVVEAMITNEHKIQEIRLMHPLKELNGTPQPIEQAQITISWQNESIFFAQSDSLPGTYFSQQPFAAAVDQNYLLTIKTDTMIYTSSTYMVPVSPFDLPVFQVVEGMYRLDWNNPRYSPFEQAMYEARISWEHLPGYNHPDTLSKAHLRLITLNTIDVSYIIFPQDAEEVVFPSGSIVVFSKYSLNDHYAAYLRAMLSETQWQGSLFESPRGNLPGNISNGGLGYFSACAVIRDTLVVE